MSRQIIKCAKCQNNAEIDYNRFRDEYTTAYPIRDKEGKIYCWDCYKSFSSCKGCGKSVANIKFPRSGQPAYLHCNGGTSYNCERISNKVEFICSEKCGKKLVAEKIQDWKDKLSQGWTKCEECWKFWMGLKSKEEGWKWLEEERNQWKVIELAQPGQGNLCPDHKSWEEDGKQRYEAENAQRQKHWETLTYEDKLKEVKKAYRADKNLTELASREKIPPLVLHRWQCHDIHKMHDCPDCHFDKEDNFPNDNSLSGAVNEDKSKTNGEQGKNENNPKNTKHKANSQLGNISPENNSAGLIIGGVALGIIVSILLVFLLRKKKKN